MEDRLGRLRERAAKRRQIVKDTMVGLDLKKLEAPDFTASVRPGMASLIVIEPAQVPSLYWMPGEPRLDRKRSLPTANRVQRSPVLSSQIPIPS